jgi:hypothetical protein
MWELLVKDKEVIVNSLDLISFIFVTPELVKIVKPPLERFLLGASGALLVFPIILIIYWFFHPNPVQSLISLIALLFFVSMFTIFFDEKFITFIDWLSRHLFLLGATLFFLSRIIAVGAALYASANVE